MGRPSYKPAVRHKSFLYRAASWTSARRVVAKVEFHFGELFPHVGCIVTNLMGSNRAAVRFYSKRGTAEQWIKEGKQAVAMTRLSCHRFQANQVRLWLSVIAYNLGNLWWDQCIDPELSPALADPAVPVWVGVDASVKRDSTAVVAATFDQAAESASRVASDLPAVALSPARLRGNDRKDADRHAAAIQRARGPLRPLSACRRGATPYRGRTPDGRVSSNSREPDRGVDQSLRHDQEPQP